MTDDVKVINAPDRIYLQIGDDFDPGEVDFGALQEVTWCADNIHGTDIAYVRADAIEANAALIALLRASLRKSEDEAEGLRVSAQNWREFAEHQTWCAVCAESVDLCPEGRDLRMAALTSQKDGP